MRAELESVLPLDKIREYARTQPIRRLSIFGSSARGEQTDGSDIDILSEIIPGSKFSLLDLAKMYRDLSDLLGRPGDIATPPMVDTYIWHTVYRDLVQVYDADN